ncbi:MAG: hypothetical protein K0R28_5777, partial [Paenibacillus sp.]|nr:hypothetical protein [Paenibacillus sp.]
MNALTNEQRAALRDMLEQERDSLERRIRQNDHFGSADPLSAT